LGYEFQFYCGGGAGMQKRRDSREETLASIMRQRSAGEQVSQSIFCLQNALLTFHLVYV
jgi:hypothetical protein